MAILRINYIDMPDPSMCKFSLNKIDEYAERDNAGYLNHKIKARKKKYELGWPCEPDSATYQALYNTLANLPEYALFTIFSPGSSTPITFEGYTGDLTTEILFVKTIGSTQEALWDMLKVNIIER